MYSTFRDDKVEEIDSYIDSIPKGQGKLLEWRNTSS